MRIAAEEGCHPLAIEAVYGSRLSGYKEKVRITICALLAGLLIFFFFPFDRFFKPRPQSLGPLRVNRDAGSPAVVFDRNRRAPWNEALQVVDRLYFEEGRLTDAIHAAEAALNKVPAGGHRQWANLYYRYWEMLADAGSFTRLGNSTRQFLAIAPEDPIGAYFLARGFSMAAEQNRTLTPQQAAALRGEADAVNQVLTRSLKALNARIGAESRQAPGETLAGMLPKLRLAQARLLALMWKLGGFREGRHPDVRLRDEALEILDGPTLAAVTEAIELKRDIYYDILLRWYWFEGSEPIKKKIVSRQSIEAELRELDRLLQKAERR